MSSKTSTAGAAAGSSPNDPNQAAGGSPPGGRPPSGDRSSSGGDPAPSPNQGNPAPTIWNSVDDLVQHPLLRTALMLVKENIELCLSKSYASLDSATSRDHKRVLLSLPGRFGLGDLGEGVRACYRPGVGIIFDKDTVNRSTNIARVASKLERITNSDSLLNFIALLQETVEHELGHMKYHFDGVKDDNNGKNDPENRFNTPEKHRHEAGFAAQESIRKNNFPNEEEEHENFRILETLPDADDGTFLMLYFERLVPEPKPGRPC